MQILEDIITNNPPLYDITEFCPISKALFIDIETTGLKKETTSLYLIGCGYYTNNDFYTKLFFADSEDEELLILTSFLNFLKDYTHLFHFNGNKFDIPYLQYKANKYNLGNIFENLTQVDVYSLIKPLRYLLFPTSMRQKVIEDFLEITREDKYNGGELIEVYKRYTKTPCENDFKDLITHNKEDVIGMHKILPILSYLSLKEASLQYESFYINEYCDYQGKTQKEVLFTYRHNCRLPKSFVAKTDTMFVKVSATDNKVLIRLPIYDTTMKLFFENYKDYYYIPESDCCMIKELCSALPKKSYVKANRDTCYQKVEATFVKQPCKIFSPSFKTDYKDKASYFRFPEDFSCNKRDIFGEELLQVFFHLKHSPRN